MRRVQVFKYCGKWMVYVRGTALIQGYRTWAAAMDAADYLVRSWAR